MDLEEELKQLQIDKDNPDDTEYEDRDEEDLSFGIMARAKKSKKEKKKKKKEKGSALTHKLDDLLGDIAVNSGDGMEEDKDILEIAEEIKKASKKKRKGIEFDTDTFMGEEGKSRKKKKDLYKKYTAQFKTESALLTALLKEANSDTAKLKSVFDTLAPNGKVRGVSKAMTDLAATIVSANGNRLQIIKALTDIKSKINDLVNKEEARKKDTNDGSIDQEAVGALALQSLFGQGNKEFNSQLQSLDAMSEEEFSALQRQNMMNAVPMNEPNLSQMEDSNTQEPHQMVPPEEDFDPDIEEQLGNLNSEMKDSQIYGRSDAGDKLIETEGMGVKIKVQRWTNMDNGEIDYEFVAVDKNGNIVEGYEVPDKNDIRVRPIRFNDDTGIASDKLGRTYEIIELGEI